MSLQWVDRFLARASVSLWEINRKTLNNERWEGKLQVACMNNSDSIFLSLSAQIGSLICPVGNNLCKQQPGGGDEDVTQLLKSLFLRHNYIWHEYASVNTLEKSLSQLLPGWRSSLPLLLSVRLTLSPVLIPLFPFLNCLPSSLPPLLSLSLLAICSPPGPRDGEQGDRGIVQRTKKK